MEPDNRAEQLKGKAKEVAGKLTGDSRLKGEGKGDQASANMKESVDKAKGILSESLGKLKDALDKKR